MHTFRLSIGIPAIHFIQGGGVLMNKMLLNLSCCTVKLHLDVSNLSSPDAALTTAKPLNLQPCIQTPTPKQS